MTSGGGLALHNQHFSQTTDDQAQLAAKRHFRLSRPGHVDQVQAASSTSASDIVLISGVGAYAANQSAD
jgi:hypothetical protein